ncbi:hypothetical protein [Nostoc linckia]|nr:hypothetical protein [Nostoc linckia]
MGQTRAVTATEKVFTGAVERMSPVLDVVEVVSGIKFMFCG